MALSFWRRYAPSVRRRGVVLKRFANQLGLIYFGSVNQHVDDHEVVRGLTRSLSHKDEHYAVGSFDGYDIALVDRLDKLQQPDGSFIGAQWLIIEVRLRTPSDLPHVFLQPLNGEESTYKRSLDALRHLQQINDLFGDDHTDEFHRRYQVYAGATHNATIEERFTSQITQTIAVRFWPAAIEVFENRLYFYLTNPTLTQKQLESLLDSALWLAQTLDEKD